MNSTRVRDTRAHKLVDSKDFERYLREHNLRWPQESDSEILRVLGRAADDHDFIAQLTYNGSEALQGYRLSTQAKAALLSGDIGWIEKRVGKLSDRLQTWLRCRLGQEIW